MLSASSKIEDVAAQVCTHVVRFFSVASMFPACREKMVEMPELVKNICRVFYYKVNTRNIPCVPSRHNSVTLLPFQHLMQMCSVACENVSALSVDGILQMHFLQAGALWHLLLFLFDYDYTLEEGGVAADGELFDNIISHVA